MHVLQDAYPWLPVIWEKIWLRSRSAYVFHRVVSTYSTQTNEQTKQTLYLTYTLSALLTANMVVEYTGIKYGLFWSLLLYCVYVFSFLVSRMLTSDLRYVGAIVGSVVGGFSAGFLWTALGNFLQASSSLYSTATTLSISKSNSLLSGIFSFTYLFGEALAKCASTWIPDAFDGGETTVYIVFTIISIACALLSLYVEDVQDLVRRQENLQEKEATSSSSSSITSKIFIAIKLLTSDIKMLLLYPNNMAFGFSSAFVLYVVFECVPIVSLAHGLSLEIISIECLHFF